MPQTTEKNLKLTALFQGVLPQSDAFELLNQVCQYLRNGEVQSAQQRLLEIIALLQSEPEMARQSAELLCRWLCEIRLYPLLISNGILGREGFGREMRARLYEKVNPSYKDKSDLRDVFFLLFCDEKDEQWLKAISIKTWHKVVNTLFTYSSEQEQARVLAHLKEESLFAIEMLAIWVAAEDLEPELIRLDPKMLEQDSPFIALQREVAAWVSAQRQQQDFDARHLFVMFGQCKRQLTFLKKQGITGGSSLAVAHLLERLNQTLNRLSELLKIFHRPFFSQAKVLKFIGRMAASAERQHHISPLWKQSTRMLARTVTQHSSDHGEHYIARNKKELGAMFLSAAGGGVLIALMALLKIYLGSVIDDKVYKGIAEGLNYGIGFTIIFMLHCTVATKQPAMTAARFAEAVERNPQGRAVNMKLAQLLVDVLRSQTIAVLGNVLVAIGVAMLVAFSYQHYLGEPLLSSQEVDYQLKGIDPTKGTLWYAAIAGIWLFLSGIISGYFDNRSNYLNTRMRLREHPLLKRIMPTGTRHKLAEYLHHNFGSIMGNFCFGLLLGLTGVVGYLCNLPLDIRHVAFSSANVGYATISADLSLAIFIQSVIFVLMIGLVNLIVSFSLTLWVALRSLNTEIDSWRGIMQCLCQIIKQRPLSLLLP